jgi:hypothetical protein
MYMVQATQCWLKKPSAGLFKAGWLTRWQMAIPTMSSPPSTANTRLSFDVLGHIFYYYAGEETIHHPLETLLLVSRCWKNAALGHRALWNNLRIYLGHSPSSSIWRKRLPLRLARAGPAVPLFITIFDILRMMNNDNIPECVENDPLYFKHLCPDPFSASWTIFQGPCPCNNDAAEFVAFALECLTGNNGELCARWKEFHVDLGYGLELYASRNLARALSHPTPLLTSLLVANIVLDQLDDKNSTPLTETPRLQRILTFVPQGAQWGFVIKDCYPLNVPDFRTLLEVELHGMKVLDIGGCTDLQSASRLQAICLRHTRADGVVLPRKLPNLRSIKIIGEEFPITLRDCQIPNLSILALETNYSNPIIDILMCPEIDIQKLQKLSLIWAAPDMDTTIWTVYWRHHMVLSLCELLNQAPNLSYMAGNRYTVNAFLKILWDSWSQYGVKGILGSKRFSLHFIVDVGSRNLDSGFKATFTGNHCPGALVTLAKKWGLVSPDLSVNEFLFRLPVSQSFAESAISGRTFQDVEILNAGPGKGEA